MSTGLMMGRGRGQPLLKRGQDNVQSLQARSKAAQAELCSPLCNSVLCSDFIIARDTGREWAGGIDYWVKQQTNRKMDKMGMLCIVSLHSYCLGLESAMVIYFSIEISYNYFQVGGTGPVTRWPVCLI